MRLKEEILDKESGQYKWVTASLDGGYLLFIGSFSENHFGIGIRGWAEQKTPSTTHNGPFAGGELIWNAEKKHAIFYRGSGYGPNEDKDVKQTEEARRAIGRVMGSLEGITYETPLIDSPEVESPGILRDRSGFPVII
ncbi:MAG: hypothetical protein KKH88_01170 [Nanoarchaeota archaeon]|nr:hypothetical protein [Nanoarchaeota archaeon]